jgi:hypothetical protein
MFEPQQPVVDLGMGDDLARGENMPDIESRSG